MAIAFDAATGGAHGDFSPTVTFAHTCTGTNLVLFVFAMTDRDNATTINSCTYNGVAMTSIASLDPGIGAGKMRLFRLVNPATGSNNVIITNSDTNTNPTGIAVSYTGVDQGSPVTGIDDYAGADSSMVVSSASGDLVIDIVNYNGADGTQSPAAGQTKRAGSVYWGNETLYVSDKPSVGATVAMDWDFAPNGNNRCYGISLKPASSASAVPLLMQMYSGS